MKTDRESTARVSTRRENKTLRHRPGLLRSCIVGLCVLAGAIIMRDAVSAAAPPSPQPACVSSARLLVKPKEGVSLAALNDLHSRLGTVVLRVFPHIGNLQILELPPILDLQEIVAAYQNSGLVAYAEPDYIVHLLMEPNDPNYWNGDLWNFRNVGQYGGAFGADIHAPAGWDIRTSASNIVVAVVDTGVRYTHEDLASNMWVNSGETGVDDQGRDKATNGVDDDGDGYADDVHGINTLLNNGDPNDDYGHGSHVAGTIGAVGNNNLGVAGVCWRVQLMACEFIDSQGNGSISDAITCIDYARSKGAKIINASWGSYSFTSTALQDAINSVRDAGIIFVAACGNNATDNDSNSLYPASYCYDNVIAVAATDRSDALAFFSNFGAKTVHLAAPGSPVFSCWNGSDSDYRYLDGTSMAAPHVAGACALVWAQYPNDSPHQIIKRVLSGVDQLPQLSGSCVTGGRLNLANALTVQPFPESTPSTVWVDDELPAGAEPRTDDGDTWSGEPWNWVTNNPVPFSGAMAHQSGIISGVHRHYFENATSTLEIFPGDVLFAYVYLDPDNPPREVMLEWNDGCWEHRAFWGENLITWGTYGTSNRRDMGELPPAGQWVRIEVPASLLGLEGATLKGMSFMLMDGRATWDYAGRSGQ